MQEQKNPTNATYTRFNLKLNKLRNELSVGKPRFNQFGKFHYRSLEDILNPLKPLLVKYGLQVSFKEKITEGQGYCLVICKATIVDADDSSYKLSAYGYGHVDYSTKRMSVTQEFGSALSYARKYALSALLLLDDSEDPDSREMPPTRNVEIRTNGPYGKGGADPMDAFQGAEQEFVESLSAVSPKDLNTVSVDPTLQTKHAGDARVSWKKDDELKAFMEIYNTAVLQKKPVWSRDLWAKAHNYVERNRGDSILYGKLLKQYNEALSSAVNIASNRVIAFLNDNVFFFKRGTDAKVDALFADDSLSKEELAQAFFAYVQERLEKKLETVDIAKQNMYNAALNYIRGYLMRYTTTLRAFQEFFTPWVVYDFALSVFGKQLDKLPYADRVIARIRHLIETSDDICGVGFALLPHNMYMRGSHVTWETEREIDNMYGFVDLLVIEAESKLGVTRKLWDATLEEAMAQINAQIGRTPEYYAVRYKYIGDIIEAAKGYLTENRRPAVHTFTALELMFGELKEKRDIFLSYSADMVDKTDVPAEELRGYLDAVGFINIAGVCYYLMILVIETILFKKVFGKGKIGKKDEKQREGLPPIPPTVFKGSPWCYTYPQMERAVKEFLSKELSGDANLVPRLLHDQLHMYAPHFVRVLENYFTRQLSAKMDGRGYKLLKLEVPEQERDTSAPVKQNVVTGLYGGYMQDPETEDFDSDTLDG